MGDGGPERDRTGTPWLVALVGALLVGSLLAAATVTTRASASPAVDPWPAGRPGPFLLHLRSEPLDVEEAARDNRLIVLNAWEWELIEPIKAVDPSTIVLVYKDLSSTRSYGGAHDGGVDADLLPTGVGYGFADAVRPDWFLTDEAGTRLEWGPWPEHWFMDVGDPVYQEQWLWNVFQELAAHGWDGAFLDNALTRADAYGPPPARYPTDEAMQAATRSMLANVGPRLRDVGFLTVANISDARLFPGLWQDWVQFVDGALEENFASWTTDPGGPYVADWGPDGWRAQIGLVSGSEQAGKLVLVNTWGASDDLDAARYGLASALLVNDGRTLFTFNYDQRFPEMAWDLGPALGPMEGRGDSVFTRAFVDGLVVVNASAERTVTVPLDRALADVSGAVRTSVTLEPTRAAILRTP